MGFTSAAFSEKKFQVHQTNHKTFIKTCTLSGKQVCRGQGVRPQIG